jgi:hypothetical protein
MAHNKIDEINKLLSRVASVLRDEKKCSSDDSSDLFATLASIEQVTKPILQIPQLLTSFVMEGDEGATVH